MKKLTALLLALVLTFSFSMTAFAADEGSADTDTGFSSNSQTTTVKIQAGQDAQGNLSATVPINVTLAVKANKDIVAPAPTSYKISNTGSIAFHVSGISTTLTEPYTFNAIPGANTLNLTLTGGSDTITLASGTSAIGAAAQWNVAAGSDLGLTFAGSVGNIAADITTATQVFTVTYTITAGVASEKQNFS